MNQILFKSASDSVKHLVEKIKEGIKETKFEGKVYLVGGCIRDLLLNQPIKDIDIAVEMKNGGTLLAYYLAGKYHCYNEGGNPIIFPAYGTARLTFSNDEQCKDIAIECVQTRKERYTKGVTTPRSVFGTAEEDSKLRDLTINSLYYNISTDQLFDYTRMGFNDLINQTLRACGNANETFIDDPLRILRTIRFSCQYGWGIEKHTWLAMLNNAHRILSVSQERITAEVTKIITSPRASMGVRKMLYCGILKDVMSDVYDTRDGYESYNPYVSTFDHTMSVLDTVQPLVDHRLAALFHDVSRVLVNSDYRELLATTNDYDKFSAEVAELTLTEMKFPKNIVNTVKTAIMHHRDFKQYPDGTVPTDKKIRKFVNSCGESIGATLDLMNANDLHTINGKKMKQTLDVIDRIEEIHALDQMKQVKLPISGNDLMKELDLKSGPIIGVLMDAIKDVYFANPKLTRAECLNIAKGKLVEVTV